MFWAYGVYHIVYAAVAACRKAGVSLEQHRQGTFSYSEKCLFPQPGREWGH